MEKIIEKGVVNTNESDQISFEIENLNITGLKISTSSGGHKIFELPENHLIEKNADGKYKITLNKDEDYANTFGVMFFPVIIDGGNPPVQDTQNHPTPKLQISYGGQPALWGKIFNLKDL
jgi:hypothetical protein